MAPGRRMFVISLDTGKRLQVVAGFANMASWWLRCGKVALPFIEQYRVAMETKCVH